MASGTRDTDSGEKQSTSAPENDERLDFFSEKFDPLLALMTPGVEPPVKTATTHDNISKYWSIYNKPSTAKQSTDKKADLAGKEVVKRRFTEDQLPVKIEPSYRTNRKSILNIDDRVDGPLALLIKCRNERLRVIVQTRHAHGFRGICECFIVLYDKYMNLTIEDVTETWTRPRRPKVPAVNNLEPQAKEEYEKLFPRIAILKSDKKTEFCRRFVKRMVLRGEHIILISANAVVS